MNKFSAACLQSTKYFFRNFVLVNSTFGVWNGRVEVQLTVTVDNTLQYVSKGMKVLLVWYIVYLQYMHISPNKLKSLFPKCINSPDDIYNFQNGIPMIIYNYLFVFIIIL